MWRRMGIPYFIPQSIAKWINPDKSGLVEDSNMEKNIKKTDELMDSENNLFPHWDADWHRCTDNGSFMHGASSLDWESS